MQHNVDWYTEGQKAAQQSDDMLKDARGIFTIICNLNGAPKKGWKALANYREFLRGWTKQNSGKAIRSKTIARQTIIDRAVEGWKGSTPVLDGSFSRSMAKFGIEEAIRQSDDESQFEQLKDYWFSLTERGRGSLVTVVWSAVTKRAAASDSGDGGS
jgi:hypothetical protein